MAATDCDPKPGDEYSWHSLGDIDSLKSKPCRKVFMKEGPVLALFYVATDRFFLTDISCPHSRGPLDQGDIEEVNGAMCVVCPFHYYRFDLTTGKSPSGLVLKTYRTEIRGQQLHVLTPHPVSLTKAAVGAQGTNV